MQMAQGLHPVPDVKYCRSAFSVVLLATPLKVETLVLSERLAVRNPSAGLWFPEEATGPLRGWL